MHLVVDVGTERRIESKDEPAGEDEVHHVLVAALLVGDSRCLVDQGQRVPGVVSLAEHTHTGFPKALYYILLYCIVLYCIVLYCIVLYCIVLHAGTHACREKWVISD